MRASSFAAIGLGVAAGIGCAEPLGSRSVGANADACPSCHVEHALSFEASPHATAGTSAVFAALRAAALTDVGIDVAEACDNCHRPRDHQGLRGQGLQCVTCHAAIGNHGTADGALELDLDGPVRGATGEADASSPHAVEKHGFHQSSALCGTCHEATGPPGFVEHTFSEHETSPSADGGQTCQDCHLTPEPGAPDATLAPGPLTSPSDTTLAARPRTFHGVSGLDDSPDRAAEQLARAIALDAITTATAADGWQVEATIANTTGAHAVPTGAAFLREVLVTAALLDEQGDDIASSSLPLSTEPINSSGAVVALPTQAASLTSHALSVGEVRPLAWHFSAVSAAPVRVRVCVEARRYHPDVLTALALDATQNALIRATCVESEIQH